MDSFINAGKKFLDENLQQQGQQGQQQQQHHQGQNPLPGGNKAFGGNYPAGGGVPQDDDDFRNAHEEAARHAGSSGNADFFSSIISSISSKKGRLAEEDIDEQDAIRKHQQAYGDSDHQSDDRGLGAAAALQALKKFTSGGSETQKPQPQSQSAFLALAMSEASKLFDDKASQGKVQSGSSKESAVQQAGELAMKMYFKSQGQKQGGLAGLASQFIK
ncbi:hypothetical protein PT974_06091 [Cladobotryum mycophilum]|uniref:DUF7721 domain-containing protein n=1 Tax=Cladobotryum mycophilum TaxID=491253 RepID=A0ABR0SLT0_9HYPO